MIKHSSIFESATFDSATGNLGGEGVSKTVRTLKDLRGVFAQESLRHTMNPDQVVYEVEMHDRCGIVAGGLFFGVSHLQPGKVGNEYFMTKGHFHSVRNRGEYYWGISGEGLLVLMDEQRKAWVERVSPGSLHYIAGSIAHRLVNTGSEKLIVGACWHADAGHDYATIEQDGFSVRVEERNGTPEVVAQD